MKSSLIIVFCILTASIMIGCHKDNPIAPQLQYLFHAEPNSGFPGDTIAFKCMNFTTDSVEQVFFGDSSASIVRKEHDSLSVIVPKLTPGNVAISIVAREIGKITSDTTFTIFNRYVTPKDSMAVIRCTADTTGSYSTYKFVGSRIDRAANIRVLFNGIQVEIKGIYPDSMFVKVPEFNDELVEVRIESDSLIDYALDTIFVRSFIKSINTVSISINGLMFKVLREYYRHDYPNSDQRSVDTAFAGVTLNQTINRISVTNDSANPQIIKLYCQTNPITGGAFIEIKYENDKIEYLKFSDGVLIEYPDPYSYYNIVLMITDITYTKRDGKLYIELSGGEDFKHITASHYSSFYYQSNLNYYTQITDAFISMPSNQNSFVFKLVFSV